MSVRELGVYAVIFIFSFIFEVQSLSTSSNSNLKSALTSSCNWLVAELLNIYIVGFGFGFERRVLVQYRDDLVYILSP